MHHILCGVEAGQRLPSRYKTTSLKMSAPKSVWRMLLESSDDDSSELVDILIDKSDRLREEAT